MVAQFNSQECMLCNFAHFFCLQFCKTILLKKKIRGGGGGGGGES